MLSDQEFMERDARKVLSTADVRFPDSLQAIIAARLDTLTQERKALLQRVGFPDPMVAPDGDESLSHHESRRKSVAAPSSSRRTTSRRPTSTPTGSSWSAGGELSPTAPPPRSRP